MTVRERVTTDERDRLVAELLQNYPPIRRLEQYVGCPFRKTELPQAHRR